MAHQRTQLQGRLSLSSIVLFGVAYMAPGVVVATFGVIAATSHGASPTAYLIATAAMLLTGLSYGKMARLMPASGSVYTYARKMLHPRIGFLAGWAILLDYFFLPMVAWLIQSIYLNAQFSAVPVWAWLVINIVATTGVNIAGVVLAPVLNACNSPLRTLTVIGISCIMMAALLALAEIYSYHKRTLDHVTLKDAMIVGVAQVGALIPGISRSGSTLTAALFIDLKRDQAARFSFLLGLPAIAAAGVKELWELHKAHLDAHGWSVLAVGLVVASVSAFFAIWGLMRVLERFSAWPFVIYRGALGVVLLLSVAMGWLV